DLDRPGERASESEPRQDLDRHMTGHRGYRDHAQIKTDVAELLRKPAHQHRDVRRPITVGNLADVRRGVQNTVNVCMKTPPFASYQLEQDPRSDHKPLKSSVK